MKLILETQELEAIVKENIAAKYPNNNISVSIQNKRNGIEVTVVLTEKLAEKEAKAFTNVSEELVATDYCNHEEETAYEEYAEAMAEEVEA